MFIHIIHRVIYTKQMFCEYLKVYFLKNIAIILEGFIRFVVEYKYMSFE